MSFWGTISENFRALTTSWSTVQQQQKQQPAVVEIAPAPKRTKLTEQQWVVGAHVHDKAVDDSSTMMQIIRQGPKSTSTMLQMKSGGKDVDDGIREASLTGVSDDTSAMKNSCNKKRLMNEYDTRHPSVSKLNVEQLISNMESSFRLASLDDFRARNENVRQKVHEIQASTKNIADIMKPEILRLMDKLRNYDPGNPMLFMARDVLRKVDQLVASKGLYAHRPSRSKTHSRDEQDAADMLKDNLWKVEQRFILVKRHLQVVMDELKPQLEVHERRLILQNNPVITTKIMKFLHLKDLNQCTTVCKNMQGAIARSFLLLRSITRQKERMALWKHAFARKEALRDEKAIKRYYIEQVPIITTSSWINQALIDRDVKRTTFVSTKSIYRKDADDWQELERHECHSKQECHSMLELHAKLSNVLKVFSSSTPDVGYCQGMTHLIAVLLSCCGNDDLETYLIFQTLMAEYQMSDVYRPTLPGLHFRCYQLQRLVKKNMPSLCVAFERLDIHPVMFASGWYMTLFTSYHQHLSADVLVLILDIFIQYGWTGFMTFTLGLLKYFESEILDDMKQQKILQKLHLIVSSSSGGGDREKINSVNIQQILLLGTSFHVTEDELNDFANDYTRNELK